MSNLMKPIGKAIVIFMVMALIGYVIQGLINTANGSDHPWNKPFGSQPVHLKLAASSGFVNDIDPKVWKARDVRRFKAGKLLHGRIRTEKQRIETFGTKRLEQDVVPKIKAHIRTYVQNHPKKAGNCSASCWWYLLKQSTNCTISMQATDIINSTWGLCGGIKGNSNMGDRVWKVMGTTICMGTMLVGLKGASKLSLISGSAGCAYGVAKNWQ